MPRRVQLDEHAVQGQQLPAASNQVLRLQAEQVGVAQRGVVADLCAGLESGDCNTCSH